MMSRIDCFEAQEFKNICSYLVHQCTPVRLLMCSYVQKNAKKRTLVQATP